MKNTTQLTAYFLLNVFLGMALTGCSMSLTQDRVAAAEPGESPPTPQGGDPAIIRMNPLTKVITETIADPLTPVDVTNCADGDTFCVFLQTMLANDTDGTKKATFESFLTGIAPDLKVAIANHLPTAMVQRVSNPIQASDGLVPWATTAVYVSTIYALDRPTDTSQSILNIAVGYYHELVHHCRSGTGMPFVTDAAAFGHYTGRNLADMTAALIVSRAFYTKQIFQKYYTNADYGGGSSNLPESAANLAIDNWTRQVYQDATDVAPPADLSDIRATVQLAGFLYAAEQIVSGTPGRSRMVKDWYVTYYHRVADAGYTSWLNVITAAGSKFSADTLLEDFLSTNEYFALSSNQPTTITPRWYPNGDVSNLTYLNAWFSALNRDLLGGVPSATDGSSSWAADLSGHWIKMSNGQIDTTSTLRAYADKYRLRTSGTGSTALNNLASYEAHIADVLAQKLLGRPANAVERIAYCPTPPNCYDDIVTNILASDDYKAAAQTPHPTGQVATPVATGASVETVSTGDN
jgi:hypothetical protein